MHDGYLFILGVCGSAGAGGPAPEVLGALMRALPPVKRAVYLSEVLISLDVPSLHDPLIAAGVADLADAEVLLVVTPLPGGRLPLGLAEFARAALPSPTTGNRFAVLITIGAPHGDPLAPLRMALRNAETQISAEFNASGEESAAAIIAQALPLAEAAYAQARRLYPTALPQ